MTENGERKPLLNGSLVCNGVGSNVIDVTGVMSDTNVSLSNSTSVTNSAMCRKKEAVQLLNHSDFDESTSRPDDLDDAWLVVSAKNARKRKENATRCVCVSASECVYLCVYVFVHSPVMWTHSFIS